MIRKLQGLLMVVVFVPACNGGGTGTTDTSAATDQTTARIGTAYTDTVTFTERVPDRYNLHHNAFISLPAVDGEPAPGAFPTIMVYTPYCPERSTPDPGPYTWTAMGYAFAHVTLQGTCGSEGRVNIFTQEDGLSGYDMVEWIATQAWSNGRVGMIGHSGPGLSQLHVARHRPPHLVTIAPSVAVADFYRIIYPGGILNLSDAPALMAILIAYYYSDSILTRLDDPEAIQGMLDRLDFVPPIEAATFMLHPYKDSFWTDSRDVNLADIDVPVLSMGNYDDFFAVDTPRIYAEPPHPSNRLVMGALNHTEYPGPNFDGPGLLVAWMDHWLKGIDNEIPDLLGDCPVEYYVIGAGEWRCGPDWPPGDRQLKLKLSGGAPLPLTDGVLTEGPDDAGSQTYLYLPLLANGTGFDGSVNGIALGSTDQHPIPGTTLTYAGEVLAEDLEVTGNPLVRLRAATNAHDADWIVRLVDISPGLEFQNLENRSGNWIFVSKGQLRASHRAGHDHFEPVPAGEPVDYEFEMRPISYLFKAGHRIAVQVSSADPTRALTVPYPGVQRIFHGSEVLLPLGPDS